MFGTMVSNTQHKGSLFDDTPRGILEMLLVAGGIALALTVAPTALMALAGLGYVIKAEDRARNRKLRSAFAYLARQKYIQKRQHGKAVRVELTQKGRRRILWYIERRTLSTPVERPQVWDKKWRVILFDIPAGERTKRNAFRSFIRRQGAVMLQKSVWVHPFDCSEQVALLKEVFRLTDEQLRLIVTHSIGHDATLRKHFKI